MYLYVFVIITYVQKGVFFLVQFNRGILEDSDLKYLAFVHKKKNRSSKFKIFALHFQQTRN